MTAKKNNDVLTIEEDDNESILESEGGSFSGSGDDNEHEEDAVVEFRDVKRKRPQLVRKKKLTKKQIKEKKSLKASLVSAGLIRPDVTTDKEKERLLRRIATKGVVQLFNAVATRQKTMSEELSKKLSMKERKEVQEKLKGSNFDVYSAGKKKAKEERPDEEDEDDLNDSSCKLEDMEDMDDMDDMDDLDEE